MRPLPAPSVPAAAATPPDPVLQARLSHTATRASIKVDHPALTAGQIDQLIAGLHAVRGRMKPAPRTSTAPRGGRAPAD